MNVYCNTAMCEIESNCEKQDAVMLLQGARKVDLDEFPSLKYMYRAGIGSENLPLEQIAERGVRVWFPPMGVREEISKAVAELTVAFIMHAATLDKSDLGEWHRYKRGSLVDKKILVIGNGHIGSKVEAMLPSRTMVYDIKSSMPNELEKFARAADIVTIHIPAKCINLGTSVAYNHHFIDAEKLSWLKNGAAVVNTSRGDIVDVDAMYDWLMDTDGVYYADVHDPEPYNGLFDDEGCRFYGTPHMASYTERVVDRNTEFAKELMGALE